MNNTQQTTELSHEDIIKPFTVNQEHLKNILEAKELKKAGFECMYSLGYPSDWKPYHKTLS